MSYIRCTAKLLHELELKQKDLAEEENGQASTLGDWYAHLFYLMHRKCVIFVNERTLFSFVAFDVTRKEIKALDVLLRKELSRALYVEGFSGEKISQALADIKDIRYGRTINRSVIGVMNLLIKEYGFYICERGLRENNDCSLAAKEANRSIFSNCKGKYPIERLATLI